jgi:hypothetical protein
MTIVEPLLMFESNSLVDYLDNSIRRLAQHLEADTTFLRASDLLTADTNTPTGRIINICKRIDARSYLNLPGGQGIYSPNDFVSEGITLSFLSPDLLEYPQFHPPFTARLSILDTLMHLGLEATAEMTRKGQVKKHA